MQECDWVDLKSTLTLACGDAQVKVIGRVALREPDRTQAMRILVMGGQRQVHFIANSLCILRFY